MSARRDAQRPDPAASQAFSERLWTWLRAGLRAALAQLRGRLIEVATVAALLGGGLLIVADFLDLFQIQTGRIVIDQQTGGAQHSYALTVIGIGVIAATLLARSTEQWPPAAAVAAVAALALGIALIGDLPEATRSDLVRGARIGDADPAAGFWMELAAALVALASGVALSHLLRRRALSERRSRRRRQHPRRRRAAPGRGRGH